MDIVTEINKITQYYCVSPCEGGSIIMMAVPYQNIIYPDGVCAVDAYYYVSNVVYHKVNEVLAGYNVDGKRCTRYVGNIKALFVDKGLAVQGRNSLVYMQPYGSRWYLEVLMVDQSLHSINALGVASLLMCDSCKRCAAACPTTAIVDRLTPSRCLRSYMEGEDMPTEYVALVGSRLMGCGECQLVCPMNDQVTAIPSSTELNSELEIHTLSRNIDTNNLGIIKILIGKNMARKNILQKNIKNIINSRKTE